MRFKGWIVPCLQTKRPAAAVIRVDHNKAHGHHRASDLLLLQLGGRTALDNFLSVTSFTFATTQERCILRGKTRVIREVSEQLFPTIAAQAPPANAAQEHKGCDVDRPGTLHRPLTSRIFVRVQRPGTPPTANQPLSMTGRLAHLCCPPLFACA